MEHNEKLHYMLYYPISRTRDWLNSISLLLDRHCWNSSQTIVLFTIYHLAKWHNHYHWHTISDVQCSAKLSWPIVQWSTNDTFKASFFRSVYLKIVNRNLQRKPFFRNVVRLFRENFPSMWPCHKKSWEINLNNRQVYVYLFSSLSAIFLMCLVSRSGFALAVRWLLQQKINAVFQLERWKLT